MNLKLGKTPARPDAVTFRLTNYVKLPEAPKTFGHEGLLDQWGMLGNDQFGDCVWAGAAHETMLWNREAGRSIAWSDTSALSDYSAVTGFNPSDQSTDQGTDMQAAASYRRKTGVLDASGVRHKVGAYLGIKGLDDITKAAYLFGAVGVGIEFPDYAMEEFNDGKPWTYRAKANIEGGHYVPLVGRNAKGNYLVVTWGKVQEVTAGFLNHFVDEAIVYVSEERLTGGKSLEGFNLSQLQADLRSL